VGRFLSERERSRAKKMAAEGIKIQAIALALGRSYGGVRAVLRDDYDRSRWVSEGEAAQMAAWWEQGVSSREIAQRTGRRPNTVRMLLWRAGARPGQTWSPSPARLSLAEREQVLVGLVQGRSLRAIATEIHRAPSTVSREVKANGGRERYKAWAAHGRAGHQARRPKASKLASSPRLAGQVSELLEQLWSPEEISKRLACEFSDDMTMQVSHETIYKSLYVQGRGALRKELAACLRSGRAMRRPRGRLEQRGHIPGMVMISERPAEVADRAVPGHWEGDLIMGSANRSAVGTLVERATRYVMLLHLTDTRAETVEQAMKSAVRSLPGEMFRTITWDQGHEMARHASFTVDTGVQVYFCDPHSPWQRGTNENTNGLLRQYMPKGTDLSVHSAEDLARIARSLNNRPRKTLDWLKPSEKLAQLLPTVAVTG
jgi:transposase, IS30 family